VSIIANTSTIEVLIDPSINEYGKLSRIEFLNRIRNVKSIRTRETKVSFYPNKNSPTLTNFEQLYQIINDGNFTFQTLTNNKLFAIGIPRKLYLWLRNTTISTLHKQLLHWYAAYYAFNSFQKFAEEEFDPLVLFEVKQILNTYYPENLKDSFNIDSIDDFKEHETKKKKALKHYNDISIKYTGSLPPEFLKNPYWNPISNIESNDPDWGLDRDCAFNILISYFNPLDWIRIIERNKEKMKEYYDDSLKRGSITENEIDEMLLQADEDTLERTESDSEMWMKWKYTFQNFEMRKEHKYSMLAKTESTVGFIYLNQDGNGATKIGWTTKTGKERISSIQTGNPTNVVERGRFSASSKKTENILHEMFKNKRARESGEWFHLSEEDIANILDSTWRNSNNIF